MADYVLNGFGGCGHGQDTWDRLWFSCEIAQCGKALISIFQQFSVSIKKILGLEGRLGTFFFLSFGVPGRPCLLAGVCAVAVPGVLGVVLGFCGLSVGGGTLLGVLFWWGGGVPVGVLCAVWVLGVYLCIFYYICSRVLGCYLIFGIAYRSVSPHGVNIVSLIVFYITVVLLVVVKEIFGTNLVASGERIFVGSDYRFLSIS